MPAIIKRRRSELGYSQTELGEKAGITARQVARYESGEQQPLLNVAVRIATALEISLEELAGRLNDELEMSGEWWAGWQTTRDGQPHRAIQQVDANHQGRHLNLSAERTAPTTEGGFGWIGEFRLWDNEVLIGWYRGLDGEVTSKGSMYFALDKDGEVTGRGRWVGKSFDGPIITGHASLARTAEEAEAILSRLAKSDQ